MEDLYKLVILLSQSLSFNEGCDLVWNWKFPSSFTHGPQNTTITK